MVDRFLCFCVLLSLSLSYSLSVFIFTFPLFLSCFFPIIFDSDVVDLSALALGSCNVYTIFNTQGTNYYGSVSLSIFLQKFKGSIATSTVVICKELKYWVNFCLLYSLYLDCSLAV